MGTLYKLEIEKLLHRISVLICFALMFSYCVMTYGERVDPFGSRLYLMDEDGTVRHGRAAIRLEREWMEPYCNVLTDQHVEEISQDIRLYTRRLMQAMQDTGDRDRMSKITTPYAGDIVLNFFMMNRLEHHEYSENGRNTADSLVVLLETPKRIEEVFPDSVLPLRLEYSRPWSGMMESMICGMFVLNLFVLLIVSPIFSEEHMHRMNALLFTSRFGKKQCFHIKIIAAYSMGLVFALAVVLLHLLVTFLFFGGDGLFGSMQISDPYGMYQDLPHLKTVGSAILDAVLLYMADAVFAVSVTVLGSVLASHVLTGMAISIILWAAPVVLSFVRVLPEQIRLVAPAVHRTDFIKLLSLPDVTFGTAAISYSFIAAGILVLFSGLITLCSAGIYRYAAGE